MPQPPRANEQMDASSNVIEAQHIGADFAVDDFANAAWHRARGVPIMRYWSGAIAPAARHAEARVLWSDAALYVRFTAQQGEPLVVSDKPRLDEKTKGLWDRDVCELFIAPNAQMPERYFEFEVAPTGEWIDLGIHQLPDRRETDWAYHSGATFAARTAKDSITLTMRVPWTALGGAPRPGARWRANLYRCVGAGAQRGYLAWQPTLTPEPSFHVPQRFGWLEFKG
ncbi:MAG TPA: carbohydrate-binding family 9-like protein [Pyrinomonadaceae bacterium]